MDELDGHRSFADAASHSFDRAVAHIAHGEDAGDIGFQQERIAIESPSFRALPVTDKIRASEQESTLVALDQVGQPIRPRQGPDENEHSARWYSLDLVG